MVKLLGFAFAVLLVCGHFADVEGDAYHRPLSMFRDYEPAWIGYALFAVLISIGLETVRTAYRLRCEAHAAMYLASTGLLAVVAATPSFSELHMFCALVVMGMMFVYVAALLYASDSLFWLTVHLLAPSVAIMATGLESYGIWQKAMISYILVGTIVHQGILAQWLPKRMPSRRKTVKFTLGKRRAA